MSAKSVNFVCNVRSCSSTDVEKGFGVQVCSRYGRFRVDFKKPAGAYFETVYVFVDESHLIEVNTFSFSVASDSDAKDIRELAKVLAFKK